VFAAGAEPVEKIDVDPLLLAAGAKVEKIDVDPLLPPKIGWNGAAPDPKRDPDPEVPNRPPPVA